jgi:hypothetical protein
LTASSSESIAVSNVTPLFPEGSVSIKYIYAVADELADAALKKHGLEQGPVWLIAVHEIADEICTRKKLAPMSKQGYNFFTTLMNAIKFRIGSAVLGLDHLGTLYDLAEIAAKHGLLPTEEEHYGTLRDSPPEGD